MYLNKALIIGNLTRDPEMRALPSGIQVCSFSVATNSVWKDKDGNKKEEVDFHNIVAFGRQAEVIKQYLVKGRPIYIEGRIRTRSWDAKDGSGKRYKTEIVLENFQFGPKPSGNSQPATDPSADARAGNRQPQEEPSAKDSGAGIEYPKEEINAEDIPF